MADWVLEEALQSAKEDREWEKTELDGLKSGEIRIRIKHGKVPVGYFKGAGIPTKEKIEEHGSDNKNPVPTTNVPVIATKSVNPQDVYRASPQHNQFGVELQTFTCRKGSEKNG